MSESIHEPPEALTHDSTLFTTLTVEWALYAVVIGVALFLRLFLLDYAPLASDEARQALASWNFVRGNPDLFTGSPLLFTGNAILFLLFGASDAAARMLPALFGSALVLVPALLRRELGRGGALMASALLAASPSLILYSRTNNGAVIAVTCALATLAFAWRYLVDSRRDHLYWAAACAALALLSARETWMVLLSTALFILVLRPRRVIVGNSETDSYRRAAGLFALVFLGIGTTFLMHREGIGAAFELFGAWLDGLRPGTFWSDPLRLLVIYEPIAFFFGLFGLIRVGFASKDEHAFVPLAALGLWFITAFLLYSIGLDKSPARLVVVLVPLLLLAGWYLGVWIEQALRSARTEEWLSQELPVFLLACALAGFMYLLLAEMATRGSVVAADALAGAAGLGNGGIIVVILMAVAVSAVTFLTVTTVGLSRARDVALAVVLALFIAWTIRQTALVNLPAGGALNPRELLITRAASSNIHDFTNDLESTSRWRANDTYTLQMTIDESLGPIIAWNLREFRNVRWAPRPGPSPDTQAIILPATAPAVAQGWVSQTYRLEDVHSGLGTASYLRWLIFRDVGLVQPVDVNLWVPSPQ